MSKIIETLKTRIAKAEAQRNRLQAVRIGTAPISLAEELVEITRNQIFILNQLLNTEEDISQYAVSTPEPKAKTIDLGNVFTTCINNGEKAAILHLCEVMESALNEGVFASDDGETVFKKLPKKAYFSLSSAIARVNAIVGGKK